MIIRSRHLLIVSMIFGLLVLQSVTQVLAEASGSQGKSRQLGTKKRGLDRLVGATARVTLRSGSILYSARILRIRKAEDGQGIKSVTLVRYGRRNRSTYGAQAIKQIEAGRIKLVYDSAKEVLTYPEDENAPRGLRGQTKSRLRPALETPRPKQPEPKELPAGKGTGDSLEAAKRTMRSHIAARSFTELAETLTNESAAALGVGLMVQAGTMAAFSPDEKMNSEFQKLSKQYDTESGQEYREQGRQFLTDFGEFIARWSKAEDGSPSFKYEGTKQIDKLTFAAITSVRVKIEGPDPTNDKPIEARYEDGKWRIHLGDLESLLKEIKFEERDTDDASGNRTTVPPAPPRSAQLPEDSSNPPRPGDAPYVYGQIALKGQRQFNIRAGYVGQNAQGNHQSNMCGTTIRVPGRPVGVSSTSVKPRVTTLAYDRKAGCTFSHVKLEPGRYLVYVRWNERYVHWRWIDVQRDTQQTLEFTIDPAKAGTLQVLLPGEAAKQEVALIPLDVDGKLPEVEVPLGFIAQSLGTVVTADQGKALIDGLRAGRYRAIAGDAWADVEVWAAETVKVELSNAQ